MSAEFNKSDFEKLKFHVDLIDVLSCDVLHSFPDIAVHEEFSPTHIKSLGKKLKFGQVFAYICLVYDINSPYAKKYSDDILKRKKVVADSVFFPRDPIRGGFITDANDIIQCQNSIVNSMVIRFLRIIKNGYWVSYCSYQDSLMISLEALTDPLLKIKDRNDHLKMSITLRGEIELIQQKFLSDDNPNLLAALYDAIEDEELTTPEYVALKEFQKENPELLNPYLNRLSIKDYMEKLKNGESVYEWDNKDLITEPESDGE